MLNAKVILQVLARDIVKSKSDRNQLPRMIGQDLDQLLSKSEDDHRSILVEAPAYFSLVRIRELLSHEKSRFDEGPAYSGSFSGSKTDFYSVLLLAQHRTFACALLAFDSNALRIRKNSIDRQRTMRISGTASSLSVIKGRIDYRLWSVTPYDDQTDLALDEIRAERGEVRSIEAGNLLQLTEFEEVEFLAVSTGAVAVQTRLVNAHTPLSVICDEATGRIIRTRAIGQEASRLQMLATLLRLQGGAEGFAAIEQLLDDKRHFVRWHAMRELLMLDPARSRPLLEQLASSDAQPAVRRAAVTALSLFANQSQAIPKRGLHAPDH